jgi:hypothetical protein
MTNKELLIQEALGSFSEEYRNDLCRYETPEVSKGTRTCDLCGLKCIKKGQEYYTIECGIGYGKTYINICKTCSWLTIQTINRIIEEYNSKENSNG